LPTAQHVPHLARCGVGGLPTGDPERAAANALSASGDARVAAHACSLELSCNCGARFFGRARGELLGCHLQHNAVHVSVRGAAAARVRLCVFRDPFARGVPPPGACFGSGGPEARGAPGSSEPGAIHCGAFKVTEGGSLALSRNEVHGREWHEGSRHGGAAIDPAREQVFTAAEEEAVEAVAAAELAALALEEPGETGAALARAAARAARRNWSVFMDEFDLDPSDPGPEEQRRMVRARVPALGSLRLPL
jgi:hypothetical protein